MSSLESGERELVKRLLNGRLAERKRAVATIARLERRNEVASYLAERLATEKHDARRSWTITALAAINRPADVEVLVRHLRDDASPWVRYWSVIGLTRMNPPDLEEHLKSAARKQEPLVQCVGLRLLGDRGDEAAFEKLLGFLDHDDWARLWATCKAFRGGEDRADLPDPVQERAVPKLTSILAERQPVDVHEQAAWALGAMPAEATQVVRVLGETMARDYPDSVRRACVDSLGQLQLPAGKTALLGALLENDAEIRVRAANGLKSVLGAEGAADYIIDTMLGSEPSDDQDDVDVRYLEALRHVGIAEAASRFGRHLQDADSRVSARAAGALANLGGETALRHLQQQRAAMLETYTELLSTADEHTTRRFQQLMGSAQGAFVTSMIMHVVVFIVGMAVLVVGLIVAMREDLSTFQRYVGVGSTVGSVGTILLLFYTGPIKNIQRSVTGLMKVNVVFQGFVRQINQVDATFKQRFLNVAGFGLEEMNQTVGQIHQSVEWTLDEVAAHLSGEGEAHRPDTAEHALETGTSEDLTESQLILPPAA